MATRTAGLRAIRQGWKDPFYRAPVKPVYVPPTNEEIAERQRQNEALMARVFAEADQRHPKIVDREARVAVAGDTDLNHDNVEAAAVDHDARDTADLDRSRVLLANCIMNCGTRIYEGDEYHVSAACEFFCPACAKAEALS